MIALGRRTVDLDHAVVRDGAAEVTLSAREVKLLAALSAADGHPISAEELGRAGWDDGGTPQALLTAINRLRAKIEPDPASPRFLRTLRNEGYALRPDGLVVARDAGLLGRSEERRRLDGAASPGALVTVTGPGGAGKTSLARALLADRGARTAFVELATAADLGDVVRLVADATGAPIGGRDPWRDLAAVRGWLPRFGVVVLDNAEQAADAVATAVERWRGSTTLVVTSRVLLGVEGEQRVELGPLPSDAARDLFLRRADAISGGKVALDPVVVDAIVDRLDRLPLAILLAAGRIGVFTPEELLRRLGEGLDAASDATAEMPARHRGLAAAFSGSWDLLDDVTRRVLGRLTAFPAAFAVHEAEIVAAEPVLEPLQVALDASLLRPPERRGRVAMYEIVRVLVRERVPADERREAEARHAAWAVAAAEARLADADRAEGAEARDELSRLVPDLLAAAERPLPHAVRAALAADAVLAPKGQVDRRLELLERALGRATGAEIARVRFALAIALDRKGDPRARAELEEALTAARTHGDARTESDALREIGVATMRVGRDSIPFFEAAIAAAGADVARAARSQALLGRHHCDMGRSEIAYALLLEATDRLARAGDGRAEASARLNLAIVQRVRDDDAGAEITNRAVLGLARRLGDATLEAIALVHLGVLALDAGRSAEALEVLAGALTLAEHLTETRLAWLARLHTVRAHVDLGEVDAALAESEKLGMHGDDIEAQVSYVRATALARRGDWSGAAACLDGFAFEPGRDHELHDLARALRAIVAVRAGDLAMAEASLAKPMAVAHVTIVNQSLAVARAALEAARRGEALPDVPGGPAAVDVRLMRALLG